MANGLQILTWCHCSATAGGGGICAGQGQGGGRRGLRQGDGAAGCRRHIRCRRPGQGAGASQIDSFYEPQRLSHDACFWIGGLDALHSARGLAATNKASR